jgi:hypothetical protein
MTRFLCICVLVAGSILLFACGGASNTSNTDAAPSCDAGDDTPSQAYKRLFEAVKSKQTDSIKAQVTENTVQLASFISAQNKTPLEKVFENGFVSSTFAATLPDIRDERVNCNMGAVEVWNASQQKWEDTPFLIENGQWKLAVGDVMRGNYRSPGKGLATKEAEAANAARGNTVPTPPAFNANRPVNVPLPGNLANRSNRR